ncbi:FkbM family methyltransferase [Tabrizicola sp. J26]|uniref:FkbM family methyltransferase n=1 Tax=Alitabrizicola rongguiensis TaxID=2909234 RepID=UPI001F00312D|nr:FkbM family methyltransferase [Tabrizicola rongguiensis]MCF1708449.1 FkbM family methyltransferase [Tabrizicola rongguiensis]
MPKNATASIANEPATSEAELRAEKLIRRQKRNLRKASAEGFLAGVAAMLRPGDLAIDCGANVGVVTAVLAETGADVIAYEPDPFAFGQLSERFSGHPRVTLINAAVGTSSGTVRLMRAGNFDQNPKGASVKSTILPGGRAIDEAGGVNVPLLDFPEFLKGLFAEGREVAFLKMDIEGAELDLLEALDRDGLLERVRVLVAETHERKFPDQRGRYRALRAAIASRYPAGRFNLDWI